MYHITGCWWGVWGSHNTHVTRNLFPLSVTLVLSHCHCSDHTEVSPRSQWSAGGPSESPATAWAQLTPCLLAATGHLSSLQSLHNPVTTNSPSQAITADPLCLPVTDSEPV